MIAGGSAGAAKSLRNSWPPLEFRALLWVSEASIAPAGKKALAKAAIWRLRGYYTSRYDLEAQKTSFLIGLRVITETCLRTSPTASELSRNLNYLTITN